MFAYATCRQMLTCGIAILEPACLQAKRNSYKLR